MVFDEAREAIEKAQLAVARCTNPKVKANARRKVADMLAGIDVLENQVIAAARTLTICADNFVSILDSGEFE
jgi:predicted outer membrane protein